MNKTILDFKDIDSAVAKANEVGACKVVTVEPASVQTIKRMYDIVETWKALDPVARVARARRHRDRPVCPQKLVVERQQGVVISGRDRLLDV
jgi:hypothetical protein